MMTMKYSDVLIIVRMTATVHFIINSVGGFLFTSMEQTISSDEINISPGGNQNLNALSMKMEHFALERRLADVDVLVFRFKAVKKLFC